MLDIQADKAFTDIILCGFMVGIGSLIVGLYSDSIPLTGTYFLISLIVWGVIRYLIFEPKIIKKWNTITEEEEFMVLIDGDYKGTKTNLEDAIDLYNEYTKTKKIEKSWKQKKLSEQEIMLEKL